MDKGLSSAYKSPNVSNRYSSYATSDAGSTSSHHSASLGSSKGANASFRPSIMSSMKMQEQELRSESPQNAAFQLNASRSFNTFGDYLKNPRSIAPYDASQIQYQNRVKMTSDSECSDKKEKILKDLKKVEEEIEKTETAIKHKRIQKKELQQQQDNIRNPANPSEKEKEEINEEEDLEPWQEIYAANRRQAAKSHAKGLSFLNPALTETGLGFRGILPQYNQPFDSARIQKLQVDMKAFKPRLLAYMSRKKRLEKKRDTITSKKYDEDLKKWTLATERKMNSSKIRAMAQRHRECFEKMFPDLKKQRENQERLKRTANRECARSEAELNEVMESLQAKENRLKKMKQQAVVVPPLLSASERRFQVLDTTGRIDDPVELYKETCKDNPVWTEKEKAAFKREYVNHPKQWHIISSLIPGGKKTVSDCVKYYYSSKKKEEYKKLVRASKRKLAPGRHPKKRPDPALAANTEDQLTATKTRFGRKAAIWKEEEVESFKNAFREFGENWPKVSEAVCRVPKSNRDAEACKNFFKNIGTCRKYKLKDVLKEHLANKEVKKEAKEEPEETFDEKSKIKDEPVSPPKPASSSPAPGTPPTSSQKNGSPLTSKVQSNSVSPKALELFLPAGVSLPSNSARSESPKSASGSWTPGKPGSRPTTPVASRVGSAAVSPIVLPVPINHVAAIPSRPSTPSQKSAQSQDIKVPQVEDQEKSSISMPSASSNRASNLFKPQQTTDARATGSPSPRTGSPAVIVGSQQKASQKSYALGKSEIPLYQQFFNPVGYAAQGLQQYPASATLVRGVYQTPQQILPQRTHDRRTTVDASQAQAQQASHRVLEFADAKNKQPSGAFSVEALINPRQRIAPKTSEADLAGQRIVPKPTDSSRSYQNSPPVQSNTARRVSECPLQMLAQAAEDAGRAESAKKRKEDEKRAAEAAKKEKELELQRIKQLHEKKKQDAIKAEQERQAEFRRQKMEEARLLVEARKVETEKKEARRREEAAIETEAKQKALREKQIAEEKRQRAIKDAERKAAEKRKLEEERKRQQKERERSERAQLQAMLEQKRREQKEAEEQKRRKIEEQEEKRRKREREERERVKLKQKQLEEEARKAKEAAADQARKLEEKLAKERAAKKKLAEEKEAKAKKEAAALERAKRDALRQIEEEEKKSAERQRQKEARERQAKELEAAKEREAARELEADQKREAAREREAAKELEAAKEVKAAKDLEADKKRQDAKKQESSKHNESTESASDVETDFVNLLYQTPSVSNVNQEVKIKFPASFELKRRNSDTLQSAGTSGVPVVNFIKDYPGKPPPDLSPKRPPDKNDEEEAKRPPPEKKARIKSPSPPPTSSPEEEKAASPEREKAQTPEKPIPEVSIPEKPQASKESETEDCSSKNLRGVTKSGDGSQGSAVSLAAAVTEKATPQAITPPPAVVTPPPVTPPPLNLYGALSEAQQQSQTIVKMEPDSEGYGDYGGGCGNYDSCGNFLAEETAIIDLLCETSSSEDEEPAYFGSDTPDLTFSPVNEEVIDDEDDDEPLDLLVGKRAEAETASESESESEAEPGTPEPRTPDARPSDESFDNRATTPNAETTLPDPEPNVETSILPVVNPNLSSEEDTSAINSPSQLSKNVSRDDSSGTSDPSPQPEKAASEANFNVLNLLADAALGNHHPLTTSKNLTSNSRPLRSETNVQEENLQDHQLNPDISAHPSTDFEKINIENVEVKTAYKQVEIEPSVNLEYSQSVELNQRKLEVCPQDNTSSFSVTHDQPHAFSDLSCDKKKQISSEKEADKRDLELEAPVEEFKVPLSPHFVKEKTSSETSCATISTVSSVANQYKILDQTKDSSVSKKTTPAIPVGHAHHKTQEDNCSSATTLRVQGHPATEKPIERVNLECEKESLANQNSARTNEVNQTEEMDLEIDESCLENAKLGLKKQEPGSFELRFSDSDRESVDSRPGSVLTSPSPHVYPFSDTSSVDAPVDEPAEEPLPKIVPEELNGSDEDESSAEAIDSESLFSNTKKLSLKNDDTLDDTLVEAEETVLEADTTITEREAQEQKYEDKTSSDKTEPESQSNAEIQFIKDHEEITSQEKPVASQIVKSSDNPGSDNLNHKNVPEETKEPKADKHISKTISEDSCASSSPEKKSIPSSHVPDDIVAVSETSVLPPASTKPTVPVPEVIKVAPSGPKPKEKQSIAPVAQKESVKAEKSASKVKATKTFMPPVGFTPPFSQTMKRKLNIVDKEPVPTGPVKKKMRVPLSQQPKTITQPRVQINPATDFSQYHQTSIYQKPQSRYVKLQPAPANPSTERLLLERQRQLEQLELKHLEERRRLEANFKAAPRTSTSPLTIVADPSRQRRVTYVAETAKTNIIQPQLALRQEQPIRPRVAAVQHIQPRAPIDPTRTFRPVQQASPTRPKQQIRCTFDLKLTNHGFRTLQRTTPSPTGQERVPIQRVIRRSQNSLGNHSSTDLHKSSYDDRPR